MILLVGLGQRFFFIDSLAKMDLLKMYFLLKMRGLHAIFGPTGVHVHV